MSGNFNPRAPYGARPAIRGYIIRLYDISIHAPHTGRDFRVHFFAFIVYAFQSTRPIRGATITVEIVSKTHSISIHAPHTGRDDGLFPQHGPHSISIHAPHTGRDLFVCDKLAFHKISIHAPHTGRDPNTSRCSSHPLQYFNPRAPYGARLERVIATAAKAKNFNPRAPYGARHGQRCR